MNFSRLPRVDEVLVQRSPSQTIHIIRTALRTGGDGPLTPFVLISRAARLASDRRAWHAEDVANALHEELIDHGWLVSDEDAIFGDGS